VHDQARRSEYWHWCIQRSVSLDCRPACVDQEEAGSTRASGDLQKRRLSMRQYFSFVCKEKREF
jgi:hypothetical protein